MLCQEKIISILRESGPVHEDIVLAKLRPGQKIQLAAYANLGIGKVSCD